jgi:hypothetical protein
MPDLAFAVESADVLEHAAVPTLRFSLRIENRTSEPIRAVTLNVQVRIAAADRHYSADEQARLVELFGEAHRWSETVKSLLWTLATVQVPPFAGSTTVDLPVTCTYDFEVVSAKYFYGLEDGDVPLELLFSGTVFYAGAAGLQVVQIPWEKETRFRMPIALWKQMMEHYFPRSAWLRLHRDTFDRLQRYRTRRALPTWDDALDELLAAQEKVGR